MQIRKGKDSKSQRCWIAPEKELLPDTTWLITYELTDWDSTQKNWGGGVLALRRGSKHKISPQSKKLFVIDTCWEKEDTVSCNGVPLCVSTHSRVVFMLRGIWQT